jgi:hypothetical protein
MSSARTRKLSFAVLAALLGCAMLATSATALPLIGFNVRGGQYTDTNKAFLGGGVDVDLLMLKASPNFEWVFVDGGNLYTVNFDASYGFGLATAELWVGGGYVLRTTSPDGFDSVTKGGVNLFVGGGLGLIPLKPFAQLKYSYVHNQDEFVWMIGARF